MPADLNASAAALRESHLVDHGLLKPGGAAEVLAAIERWRGRGLRAYVFISERNEDLASWRDLWSAMSLDPQKDLLLLFNGLRWDARGWGLGEARVKLALQTAEPALRSYYARGLVTALDELGLAATASRAEPASQSREPGGGLRFGVLAGILLAISAALLGWVLRRRKAIAGRRYAEFENARLSAEQTYADVMLAAEALPDLGTGEKRRASELKGRLDRLGREAAARPMAANDPILLGKVQQLENEIAVLHSVILQRTKGN
ncbi:MAG TPA: hypothetical protein VF881_06935 [Polyangiaceae bacterium]